MPLYEYKCPKCKRKRTVIKSMAESSRKEYCKRCGIVLDRLYTIPMIYGTRDNFGIGKEFIDPESGKEITTWKEWEQAGYRKAIDVIGKGKRGEKAKCLFKEKLAKKQKNTIQI